MTYVVLGDHANVFEVPEVTTSDKPLWIGITAIGGGKWAYTLATGPFEADAFYEGDDLGEPEISDPATPSEMVTALCGFLGAYGEGRLIEPPDEYADPWLEFDGDVVAVGDAAVFISENGERFSMADSELENGYLAYTDTYYSDYLGQWVRRAFPTGKENE